MIMRNRKGERMHWIAQVIDEEKKDEGWEKKRWWNGMITKLYVTCVCVFPVTCEEGDVTLISHIWRSVSHSYHILLFLSPQKRRKAHSFLSCEQWMIKKHLNSLFLVLSHNLGIPFLLLLVWLQIFRSFVFLFHCLVVIVVSHLLL